MLYKRLEFKVYFWSRKRFALGLVSNNSHANGQKKIKLVETVIVISLKVDKPLTSSQIKKNKN